MSTNVNSTRDTQPSCRELQSSHYIGEGGERYFAYQSRFGDITGPLVAQKFSGHIRPSDVVLDFGCGGGFILKALTCRERLGVEINPIARRTAERNGILCFEALDQIANTSVDIVISHHSLEHVASPLQALRELLLKLKPGGQLLIVVPIDDWRTQKRYNPADLNHHLYTWTPLLLGNLLFEAGFDTSTLSTTVGINGWFRGFHRLQGSIPPALISALSYIRGSIRKTREIYGVVRAPQLGSDRRA